MRQTGIDRAECGMLLVIIIDKLVEGMEMLLDNKRIKAEYGNVLYWRSDSWIKGRPVLFFLHGMTADHTMFQPQYEFFQNKYNIITWDAPAHGGSRPFTEFNYETIAQIIRSIFETENIEHAVFIGQSMGGFITQAVIKRFPKLVSAFVSIDSCPYGISYYSKSDIWWIKQIGWMAHLYPAKTMKKAIAKQNTATSAGYENMISMLSDYRKAELCHLMEIGYASILDDNCDLKIDCPTILIVGEQDKTGKVKIYNKQWSEATGFPLIIIDGAAHNSNVDQPQQVNKAIESFLTELP